jgi:hypothetical protein
MDIARLSWVRGKVVNMTIQETSDSMYNKLLQSNTSLEQPRWVAVADLPKYGFEAKKEIVGKVDVIIPAPTAETEAPSDVQAPDEPKEAPMPKPRGRKPNK